jgi:hypothetical protein
VRAGLDHDRVAHGEPLVHEHVILAVADGRQLVALEVPLDD